MVGGFDLDDFWWVEMGQRYQEGHKSFDFIVSLVFQYRAVTIYINFSHHLHRP